MPESDPSPPALADDLRTLLHTGLPVPSDIATSALLALPGVSIRAVDADDDASKARALDGLLRWQLAQLDHELAGAARILFGAAPGTAGSTLTERRTKAAQAAGYEAHHFRKRIEPRLCSLLADMLAADSEEFAAMHAAPPVLTATSRGPLRLPADVFAWEAVEHERMLSMLWSAVYALRADLLDLARLVSMDVPDHDRRQAIDTALWRYGQMLAAADEYRLAYGETLLHTGSRLPPRGLARLAGWIPTMRDAAADQLSATARTAGTRQDFLALVPDARDAWRAAFTTTERTAS